MGYVTMALLGSLMTIFLLFSVTFVFKTVLMGMERFVLMCGLRLNGLLMMFG